MATASLEGLTLHVADVQRSVDFYAKFPGAQVLVHRPGNFALLRIGAMRLGLLQHAQDVRFHLEVETDDLQRAYEQLREAGIEPDGPPRREAWGETDFMVRDPDGYTVEFGLADAHPD